ncbi:MAG: 50S ribosomal protein L1 [Myxococcota bacterium]|jgi:large subunit ribosomal protein L1|nr:50S ribosomal protein L1 [Myxococcota bacterium]
MAKHGKKFRAASSRVDSLNRYGVTEAVELVKDLSFARFDESIDLSVNLNVNPRHADQMVRGSVALPHGTGKDVRVLVFAKGEKAIEAREAGADFVGEADLIEKIQGGWLEFDTAVATPDMMGQVGRIGRVLGPRGLMPNPKTGTVTFDVGKIVGELKAGRVEFRVDKAGIIHVAFGRSSFTPEKLEDNLRVIIERLARLKPASAKSPYFRTITISSTMGPGIKLDTSFAAGML